MAVHNLETISELEDKILSAKDDKVILLHPFCKGMSEKGFAAEMTRLAETHFELCCYSLDLQKVEDAYKVLEISGLPMVMFFKNGDKIDELIGTNRQKEIVVVLQGHLPGMEISSPPPLRKKPREVQPSSCSVCDLETVAKSLRSHPSDSMAHEHREIDVSKLIGNVDNCRYCRFLVQSSHTDLSVLGKSSEGKETAQLLTKRDIGLARIDFEVRREAGSNFTPLFKTRHLQVAQESDSSSSNTHFSGRVVGTQANIDLCRSWLQLCKTSHSSICKEETIDLDQKGLRFIDVKDRCVVDAKKCCVVNATSSLEYAALSYVWGDEKQHKQLKLETGTLERLFRAKGLGEKDDDIPKTISDAMKVASLLGLRYLWVDALCIKQDDLDDKKLQIDKMDRIYCCASVTIVGTGPGANSGLPGLDQSSRTPNQTFCEIGDVKLISSLLTLSEALSASSWDKRGWTLQEKALSKRLLIFTNFQVYWHCNYAVYAEDTILEYPGTRVGLRRSVENYEEYSAELRLIYKPSPRTSASAQYMSFLRSYMRRNLTNQSDALTAFSGVLNALKSELGDHLCGLPTRDFGSSMLWKCAGHFPKRRRDGFPSWSWAGWIGGQDVDMDESGSLPSARIWWWRNLSDQGEFTLINPSNKDVENSGYTNEFFGVDTSSAPPRPSDIFKEEIPRVPFPTHILRFWTSAAYFSIDRKPYIKPGRGSLASTSDCSEYHVYIPGQQKGISSVILNNEWREERGDVDKFEVIFFSRGNERRFKYDIKVWTMLIEWNNGIAYRVQIFTFPLRLEHWEAAKPQFKLISLI